MCHKSSVPRSVTSHGPLRVRWTTKRRRRFRRRGRGLRELLRPVVCWHNAVPQRRPCSPAERSSKQQWMSELFCLSRRRHIFVALTKLYGGKETRYSKRCSQTVNFALVILRSEPAKLKSLVMKTIKITFYSGLLY